ncbi:MAG: hypothetical protein IEMM0006_0797 [bacterium]|nr:MAG: hypothetical protein IEMM0006_0797 [bacterium]
MLPLTYNPEDIEKVLKETEVFLKKNNDLEKELFSLLWSYHSIGNSIPQTTENYWSGHYFPYSESYEELQISFLLCKQGLYKQAMTSLRSVLEVGILSVYYNISDEGHKLVQGWYQSESGKENDTPYFNTIWKVLKEHENFVKFNFYCDLEKRIKSLGLLHNYVHTKGLEFSNDFGLRKSNTLTFQEKGFMKWIKTAKEVVSIVLILHLLKYPIAILEYDYSRKFGIDVPEFGGLNSFGIERIKEVLGKETIDVLLNIALEDKKVIALMNEIENMPDISEEEVQKQIESINRIMKK